jgi:hypothetical protein
MQAKAVEQVNLFIVVWDNECCQSIGGPPTHTSGRVDIAAIARGAGIDHAYTVKTPPVMSASSAGRLGAGGMHILLRELRWAIQCMEREIPREIGHRRVSRVSAFILPRGRALMAVPRGA